MTFIQIDQVDQISNNDLNRGKKTLNKVNLSS